MMKNSTNTFHRTPYFFNMFLVLVTISTEKVHLVGTGHAWGRILSEITFFFKALTVVSVIKIH